MQVALMTTFAAMKKEPLADLLARFTGERSFVPNMPAIRQVSNWPDSVGAGQSIPFATLLEVAAGKSLTGTFSVHGLGFSATLPLPVSKRAIEGGQYRIGDAAHWQQLVDNMAAIAAELDRTFVPAIEAAAGPSPEWYKPETP